MRECAGRKEQEHQPLSQFRSTQTINANHQRKPSTTHTTTNTLIMEQARSMLEANDKWAFKHVPFDHMRRLSTLAFSGETSPRMMVESELRKNGFSFDNSKHHGPHADIFSLSLSNPILHVKQGKGFAFGHPALFGNDHHNGLRSIVVVNEYDPTTEFGVSKKRASMHKLQLMCMFVKMKLTDKKNDNDSHHYHDHDVNPAGHHDNDNADSRDDQDQFDGSEELLAPDTEMAVQQLDRLDEKQRMYHQQYGPSGKHWAITHLGVDDEDSTDETTGFDLHQEILQQINEMADVARVSCYVECYTDASQALYESFGYHTAGTETVADAVVIRFMIREPSH